MLANQNWFSAHWETRLGQYWIGYDDTTCTTSLEWLATFVSVAVFALVLILVKGKIAFCESQYVWVPPLAWVTQTGSCISCAVHWRTTHPQYSTKVSVILFDAGQFGHQVQIFACRKVGLTFAQRRKLGRRLCMWSHESTFSFKNVNDSGCEGGSVDFLDYMDLTLLIPNKLL